MQRDTAVRTDSKGLSDMQDYAYTPNPEGSISHFRLDKTGRWRELLTNDRGRLGVRDEYYDFSF